MSKQCHSISVFPVSNQKQNASSNKKTKDCTYYSSSLFGIDDYQKENEKTTINSMQGFVIFNSEALLIHSKLEKEIVSK